MRTFVDIHDVTHVYARAEDGLPAVERLNIKIHEGEFAAIVSGQGAANERDRPEVRERVLRILAGKR